MDSLLQLAERCEAAEASEQRAMLQLAFDAAFPRPESYVRAMNEPGVTDARLLDLAERIKDHMALEQRFYRMLDAEAYESAAMMLVPEGLEWELFGYDAARDPRFGRFQARIMLLTYAEDPDELGPQAIANAATPALALCAAALRARHSQGVSDNGK